MIGFVCTCGIKIKRVVAPADLPSLKSRSKCPACQQDTLIRQVGNTSSVSKVKVDNGLMSKAVELTMEVIDDKYGKKV